MFYLWVNFFGISDYAQVDVNAINKLRHYAFHLRKAKLAEVHHMLEKINKEKTIQSPYLGTFEGRIFLFIYICNIGRSRVFTFNENAIREL